MPGRKMATGASDDTIFLRLQREWAGVVRRKVGGAAREALECGRGGEAGDVASYLPAAAAADSSVGAEKDRGRRSPSPGSLLPGSPVSYFGGSPKRLSGVMGTGRQDMEMGPEAGRVEEPGRRVGGRARLGGDEQRARNEKERRNHRRARSKTCQGK